MKKKALAIVFAVMMISAMIMGTLTAMAAEPYDKVSPKATAAGLDIKEKLMVVEVGAKNPKVTYTLTLGAGKVYKDGSKTYGDISEVGNIAGVNDKTLASVTYDAGEVVGLGNITKGYTISSDIITEINKLTFDRPGIYYWPITKTVADSKGAANPDIPNNNKSQVSSNGTALVIRVDENSGALLDPVVSINVLDAVGNPTGNKDALYEDTFTRAPGSLTVKNEVTGNQGSKDQYFKYEIEITGMDLYPGAKLKPIGSNSVKDAKAKYGEDFGDKFDNLAEVTVNENGKAVVTVWLKDQETIEIPGIPQSSNVKYKITESENTGYDVTNTHTDPEDSKKTVPGTGNVVGSDPVKLNPVGSEVIFKNDKATSVPTGVITAVAPAFAVIAIGGIGAGVVLAGKRRDKEDEEE
jgi:hypothetical protein